MADDPTRSEKGTAFIASIDARFPYRDEVAARASVCEGAAISDNAALMVAHELAFAPDVVPTDLRLGLLDLLVAQRPSVLVQAAKPVVRSLILRCKAEPLAYGALNILAECSTEYAALAEDIRSGP